ncbi:MAG TPA: LamG-like jellyroll fold domain-containing protein, partial [Kofleriaceae bacterium]|nr:LamG-like jellyroll fold domain-containing protein [Kofleriaceae bacterium]
VTFDALAGDRFLVAVAPTAAGQADVALQIFVSPTGATFPSACQFALTFEPATVTGNTVEDQCNGTFTHSLFDGGKDTPPVAGDAPFPELGKATDLGLDAYFTGSGTIDARADFTVQFWVKWRGFDKDDIENAWLFSDLDLDVGGKGGGGGLGLAITNPQLTPAQKLDITTCTNAEPLTFLDTTTDITANQWTFIRMVQTGGSVYLCLDGARKGTLPVAAPLLTSTYPPYLGRNAVWTPSGAFFNGEFDDFRVLTGALPCN